MVVNYCNQKVIIPNKKEKVSSIFLAGPTPKNKNIESWRKEAIRILGVLEFDGIVYCPECENGGTAEYAKQALWEKQALEVADCIMFWIDRDIVTLTDVTMDVQFGYWIAKKADRVVYGRPDFTAATRYCDWLYNAEKNEAPVSELQDLVIDALICTSEKRFFGKTEKQIIEMIDKLYKTTSAKANNFSKGVKHWKNELRLRLIAILEEKSEK